MKRCAGVGTHPRSRRVITWASEIGLASPPADPDFIARARCGVCGDSLRVSTPSGTIISPGDER